MVSHGLKPKAIISKASCTAELVLSNLHKTFKHESKHKLDFCAQAAVRWQWPWKGPILLLKNPIVATSFNTPANWIKPNTERVHIRLGMAG